MNNTSAREKSMQQNILGNYDSYIMDDKKKMYELERQVGYLIQDNKWVLSQKPTKISKFLTIKNIAISEKIKKRWRNSHENEILEMKIKVSQ